MPLHARPYCHSGSCLGPVLYSPGIQPNQVTVPLCLSLVMTVGDKKHIVFEYGKFDIKS